MRSAETWRMYLQGQAFSGSIGGRRYFEGNYAELYTPEIDRFLELAKHHLVVPFGYTCLGGGKDLCAIGIFARNVMDRAALIVQQKS